MKILHSYIAPRYITVSDVFAAETKFVQNISKFEPNK
jgi:hypothetical protein